MKAFCCLLLLLTPALASADTYIVAFHAFAREREDKEAKDALWALAERVKNPLCLRYIPYKKATDEEFMKKMRMLKKKATKDDVVIVYIDAHGNEWTGGLIICCKEGRSILSRDIFPLLEALPCPTLLLIDTCHSGAALQHKWKKTTVVCACRHDELSWTGGMGPAFVEALRQPRQWTIEQLAVGLMARTQAIHPKQHPVAFIGSTANARITK